MSKQYILKDEYQYLSEPCSYADAFIMLHKDHDNCKRIEIIEYTAKQLNEESE